MQEPTPRHVRAQAHTAGTVSWLVVLVSTSILAGCFEPRARYHRPDYKFSWQDKDVEEERRASMIYTQPPKTVDVQGNSQGD